MNDTALSGTNGPDTASLRWTIVCGPSYLM